MKHGSESAAVLALLCLVLFKFCKDDDQIVTALGFGLFCLGFLVLAFVRSVREWDAFTRERRRRR